MKIKFLGHASFLITSRRGTRIITDPYKAGSFGGGIGYSEVGEKADLVTISHEHDDHNDTAAIQGKPVVVRGAVERTMKDVKVKGFDVHHDKTQGAERGSNTVFLLEVDGMRVLHLGDLGHELDDRHAKAIGPVDVLMVPVGGFFTIDAQEASQVIKLLRPSIILPMHYKTAKCGFPIAGVDSFLGKVTNVKTVGSSELDISELPEAPTVFVLDHAR